MSELRLRRGASDGAHENKLSTLKPEDIVAGLQEQVRQTIIEKVRNDGFTSTPKKVVEGISNETKKAKDQLAKDPTNLDLMFELGNHYIDEEKFVEASNVLIRGWKRVNEIKDPTNRYLYLSQLCEVSLRCGKHRQAYAIMQDFEEPADTEYLRDFHVLRCKVFCNNGAREDAYKAFSRSIVGTCFDEVLPTFGELSFGLKKVGAYSAAKDTIERLATTEQDKAKLMSMEKLLELQETINKSNAASSKLNRGLLWVAAIVLLCVFGFILHWLEGKNLQNLKLKL